MTAPVCIALPCYTVVQSPTLQVIEVYLVLKKFLRIQNVARFEGYAPSGDVEFRKFNIVYGDNGRGKSSLCAILRSLSRGDAGCLKPLSTVGAKGEPEVDVLVDTSKISYSHGNWSRSGPAIEIFDNEFIEENVYAGSEVDQDHKRNLCGLMLGVRGVSLAAEIDDLDAKIRRLNASANDKALSVQRLTVDGMTHEVFVGLKPVADVEGKIKAQEELVSSLKDAQAISERPLLAVLQMPDIDQPELEKVLYATLETIAADAEERTRSHIAQLNISDSEAWIQKGLALMAADACPFCGASTDGNDLILAYRGYFDEGYRSLKKRIVESLARVEAVLSQSNMLQVQRVLSTNTQLLAFWRGHSPQMAEPALIDSEVLNVLSTLKKSVLSVLAIKQMAVLEPLSMDPESAAAFGRYRDMCALVTVYNKAVADANSAIVAVKNSVAGGDLRVAEAQLCTLRNSRIRYTPAADKLCSEYASIVQERDVAQGKKQQAKTDLDSFVVKVLGAYENRINAHLENSGAGFSIAKFKPSYPGGKASLSYALMINNCAVELTRSSKNVDGACFKTALSTGDKRALAFAFFLAKLEGEADLDKKIVVFDDPVCSLDYHRKSYSADQIAEIGRKAHQLLAFSHDLLFASLLDERFPSSETRTLIVERCGSASNILQWDLRKATRAPYYENYAALYDYCNSGAGGNRLAVVRCIRPLLEENLRMRFPHEFGDTDWLGNAVSNIENADLAADLSALKPHVNDLRQIKDYCKRFHHDQNPGADSEPINDTELKTYAKRALKFASGP